MARAAELTAAMPNRTTLFLTIELCSLFARTTNPSLGAFVSSALFGDGAAADLLRNNGSGGRPKIRAVGEWCSPKTEHVLGYTIRDDGFGILLSAELPKLLARELGPAVDTFLAGQGLTRASLDGHIFHPGGRKILEAAESVLGANFTGLDHAWGVLRDFGNMSSAGIIFVLARALAAGISGRYLISAFGPGFSTHSVLLDV